MKGTFLLLTAEEMSEIAKQTGSVDGQSFIAHLYGNAIQMAVLKKNGYVPETLGEINGIRTYATVQSNSD